MAIKNISEEMPQLEKDCLRLSIVCKKPVEYFESMEFRDLNRHRAALKFLDKLPTRSGRAIWIGFKRYRPLLKPEVHSTEIWLSLVHYRDRGVIQNLHNILAWIYKPMFGKAKEEDFKRARMADVYGTFFLFCQLHSKWKAALKYSEAESLRILMEHLTEVTTWTKGQDYQKLQSTTAGSTL
jgi:hypothetical protein